MIRPGLVSVTFRQLIPTEIVRLASQAGLEGIEWGSDVHVPVGDQRNTQEVRSITADANLEVVSYGSYYRVGVPKSNEYKFKDVFNTAVTLGAPAIRVWAGVVGSDQTDEAAFQTIVTDLQRIADVSMKEGVAINVEFHRGTFADQARMAIKLKRCVDRANVFLYWQPDPLVAHNDRLKGLYQMAPHVSNLHVFHWESKDGSTVRHSLESGKDEWSHYLDIFDDPGYDRYALLEFVREDSQKQFLLDAATLKRWLKAKGRMT